MKILSNNAKLVPMPGIVNLYFVECDVSLFYFCT